MGVGQWMKVLGTVTTLAQVGAQFRRPAGDLSVPGAEIVGFVGNATFDQSGGSHSVNALTLEQYLRSVVASEVSPGWADLGGAAALQAHKMLEHVDFLSIGTNDLTQFLFAADRADPRLAQRYDWLSPAILRFLKRILDAAREAGVPVRVCGEMAGRPLEAMALIGIGVENVSITPAAVGPIKATVRGLDAGAIRARMEQLLARPPPTNRYLTCGVLMVRVSRGSGRTEQEVKELLQKFAQMRQMMVQLGASTGLMGKIPGMKQFSQMKKLANMDINALMAAGGARGPRAGRAVP